MFFNRCIVQVIRLSLANFLTRETCASIFIQKWQSRNLSLCFLRSRETCQCSELIQHRKFFFSQHLASLGKILSWFCFPSANSRFSFILYSWLYLLLVLFSHLLHRHLSYVFQNMDAPSYKSKHRATPPFVACKLPSSEVTAHLHPRNQITLLLVEEERPSTLISACQKIAACCLPRKSHRENEPTKSLDKVVLEHSEKANLVLRWAFVSCVHWIQAH